MKCTKQNVLDELMWPDWERDEYESESEALANRGAQAMTKEQAEALFNKHKAVFDDCVRMGSFAYYAAWQIIKAEARKD